MDLAHLVQTPLDQIRFDPEIERNLRVGAPTSHALEDVDAVRRHRLLPEELSEHLELPTGVDRVALRPRRAQRGQLLRPAILHDDHGAYVRLPEEVDGVLLRPSSTEVRVDVLVPAP
jgi:hypothetical protein